jgi:organic radical activating enzyme
MAYTIVDDYPEDPRTLIGYVEFYITNVCNLNCHNCNRFNNYHLRGHQLWQDHAAVYAEWAKHVRFQKVTILGGEPLLNPSLLDWVKGINQLWNKAVQIQTNGTRINKVPGLYEVLLQSGIDPRLPWVRNWIGISMHNEADRDRLYEEIHKFLQPPIRMVKKHDAENHNNSVTMGAAQAFIDKNNVRIPVWDYDSFYTAAITFNESGRHTLHNSDVKLAHDNCGFVRYKCYHFIGGALYKCGPVALFPEFDKQFNLDISDQDRELLNSYRPLEVSQFADRGQQFLATIDDPIPQCKFCPSNYSANTTIRAVSKKPNSTSGFQ